MAKGTLNKVMLIGRLGADPEMSYTPSNQAVTKLRLATNEVWKDKEGNQQERTEWHNVVLWQKQAEIANEYLKKGNRVYIEGRLQTRSWEDKDGIKRYWTEVVAQSLEFLESRDSGGGSSQSAPAPSDDDMMGPQRNMDQEDDLPF